MKKIYSIVLMAAALLVGTNAWGVSVNNWDDLKTELQKGGEVILSADINVTADNVATWRGIWIGTENEDDTNAPKAVLDLNGHNITINSGEYKNSKGVLQEQALDPFVITKGSLTIKSATPAKIEVTKGQSILSLSTNVFFVFGSLNTKVDPKGNDPFTYLEIGKNVTVQTQNGTVIAIDALTTTHAAIKDLSEKPNYGTSGKAFGVRVDVEGTLISQGAESTKLGGTPKSFQNKCYGVKVNGNVTLPDASDKQYAPYVHIYPSATLQSDNRSGLALATDGNEYPIMAGSAAAYASGYGQWLIEGNCNGSTGVYIGSGIVNINNAQVKSAAAEYDAAGAGGHANGSGSAIVINSRKNYPGDTEVTITGDTKAESTSGYAVEEVVNTATGDSKVETISIQGGTFEGGSKGALIVTEKTTQTAVVSVTGGNVNGNGTVGQNNLADYLASQGGTHYTLIEDGGKTVLVISEGNPPTGLADFSSDATASVKWTGDSKEISGAFALKELEINGASAQLLTVKKDATLTVERVVLGANAQIVVKAGGKFIVTGEQGIVAPSENCILLEASETDGQAMFLFNPAVKSNRHPNATVQFISNSITDGAKYSKQRFAIPTYEALTSMTTKNGGSDVQTAMSKFYYEENKWKDFGWINVTGKDENLDQMATPFEYYQMQHNTKNFGTVVTMKGQLFGNESPQFAVIANSWNGYANSYMAPINAEELIDLIPETVDKSFQIYEINKTTNKGSWQPVSRLDLEDIRPMQAFLIRNTKAAANVNVNYEKAVYSPATVGKAPRRIMDNITKAKLIVNGEDCIDRVIVAEGANFSAEFDNGYDAAKYMNDGINMYVSADEKMGIYATDDLENTYIGFQSINGGNYTIEFANVEGKELTLLDLETGVRTAMIEGNVYEFAAAANTTNDYRFQIVARNDAPTAIENTEAVKSVKGIYTITGQYVGEMNVWNTLPAGVYVVDGAKRVK